MSTDVADAKPDTETPAKAKRGGQRGERPFRDKPTNRERVLMGDLSKYIKKETGRDVSPETVRAVRFCLPKWGTAPETKELRENMDKKLEKAKLQDKREKALAMLKEADSELSKYDSSGDLDDDDEDEDAEDEEDEDFEDTDDSGEDDEDDDVFSDDSGKVSAQF